ncbi:MAG: formyl transferase [Flavobacteriaceae bacterium]|jgi:phosphoribosylglycinamide formyltransferase-1|nr:formyl transferase [Flavobacteriaceae bacterium]
MKKIAVITYDHPTRKTQEILLRLKGKNYQKVDVYALPFVLRKPLHPLISHRPAELILDLDNEQLAANLEYTYIRKNVEELSDSFNRISYDAILIAGAGLLPEDLVKYHKIINSHPGYLPYVRGLDAVKWAVYEKLPIGVTVHFVDQEADAGLLITRKKLDIFPDDTFHSMCFRLWNLEMQLLVDAIELIEQKKEFIPLSVDFGESHRRMPKEKEKELYRKFEEYKESYPFPPDLNQ